MGDEQPRRYFTGMKRLIYILLVFIFIAPLSGQYVGEYNGQVVAYTSGGVIGIQESDIPGYIISEGDGDGEGAYYYWDSITADYWLDAIDGSDSNEGTSREAPIQTLTKLNQIISASSEGITIAISDTAYYGHIVFSSKTGTANDKYLILGADKYGNGKPSIKGYKALTSWSSEGGNLYTKVDADLPSTEAESVLESTDQTPTYITILNSLYIDYQTYGIAQTPDDGYYDIESVASDYESYFVDSELGASTDEYAGAYAYLGIEDWIADKARITSNTATQVNLDTADFLPQYDMNVSGTLKYKIVNDTPDANLEWKYDYSQKEITLYSTADPSTLDIYTPWGDSVIYIANSQYVRLCNLNVYGGNLYGVYILNSDDIEVDSCKVYNSGFAGIAAVRSGNVDIEYDTVVNGNSNGIYVTGSDENDMTHIYNCYVEGMGEHEYFGDREGRHYMGIFAKDNIGDTDFRYNHIDNTGYNGVFWANLAGATQPDTMILYGNLIEDYNFHLADGGGIYVYGENDWYKVIRKNIVTDPDMGYEFIDSDDRNTMGIYLDQTAEYFVVDSNTVYNSLLGIFQQSTSDHNTYKANILTNFTRDHSDPYQRTGWFKNGDEDVYGNYTEFNYNISVVTDADTGWAYIFENDGTPSYSGMDIDTNYYFNPFRADGVIIGSKNGATITDYTLANWRTYTGWETNSTYNQASWMFSDVSGIDADEFVWCFINWSSTSHQFDLGNCTFKDVGGNNVSGTVTVEAYYSKILFYASGTLSTVDNPIYKGE